MIGQQVVLVLIGMTAGVAASLATGLAVRIAVGARPQAGPEALASPAHPAPEADHEQEIAIALAAISGFGRSR